MKPDAHKPDGQFLIDLSRLPPHGKDFAGEITADIFQLEKSGPRWLAPLKYEFHMERQPGWLIVTGWLETSFELECVRCLEPFVETIVIDDYFMEHELDENTSEADLTERIREDILLALPGYPHCDESDTSTRSCPAAAKFQPSTQYSERHPDDQENTVKAQDTWGTLDQLKLRS